MYIIIYKTGFYCAKTRNFEKKTKKKKHINKIYKKIVRASIRCEVIMRHVCFSN